MPEQRKFLEIREAAERSMFDKVFKAIDEAAAEVARHSQRAGLDFEPTRSGGDLETLQGGDPDIGQRIVNNGEHIIDSYWRNETGAQANATTRSSD